MRRFVRFAVTGGILINQFLGVPVAHGEAAVGGVVISQLSTGDTQSASNEFVELYNNSASDIDISNWCIRYATAANSLQGSPKYCFAPADAQTKIYLSSHQYALVVTSSLTVPGGGSPDGRFSGSGMAATGGHILLQNNVAATIDVVGWGTAIAAETLAATAPTSSQSLARKVVSEGVLKDTNDNKSDFEPRTPLLHGGGIYEVRTAIDICGNLDGVQEILPAGYGYDEAGNCELLASDLCNNIAAIQLVVPDGLVRNDNGSCSEPPKDICSNLDGLQVVLPTGYTRSGDICVPLESRALWLDEILPNASGDDTGREFIELYNPNDSPISLDGYVLYIGKNFEKPYSLPSIAGKTVIPPYGFVTFSDSEMGVTLLNTSNGIRLVAPAGNPVSETYYTEAKDDQAWAYVDGGWQYTTVPTPGYANEATPGEGGVLAMSTLAPCPAGKYRNPLTNRCRTIEDDAAILTDCQEGYYRNPETNRCRKIALAAALTPCQAGYMRNPETNRCRKDEADDGLTPCKEGQERNPETNRCRKVAIETSSLATPAAAQSLTTNNSALPWVIGIAALGALGYGVFEWRHEIGGALGKFIARFRK